METAERVAEIANRIAAAIARRDVTVLRPLLAAGFIQRTHGGGAVSDVETFLRAVEGIPGEIRFIRLEHLQVDVCPAGALGTGIQYAQVIVDGRVIEDRRGFVDWFVEEAGGWRLQAAVDLPTSG
jgi:Domain of unknown function (DUF4440)